MSENVSLSDRPREFFRSLICETTDLNDLDEDVSEGWPTLPSVQNNSVIATTKEISLSKMLLELPDHKIDGFFGGSCGNGIL